MLCFHTISVQGKKCLKKIVTLRLEKKKDKHDNQALKFKKCNIILNRIWILTSVFKSNIDGFSLFLDDDFVRLRSGDGVEVVDDIDLVGSSLGVNHTGVDDNILIDFAVVFKRQWLHRLRSGVQAAVITRWRSIDRWCLG